MRVSDMFPSEFLAAADLRGRPRTVTIAAEPVRERIKTDTVWVLALRELDEAWRAGRLPCRKRLVINKTNSTAIEDEYGDTTDWPGKQIVIYPTTVKRGGDVVACIRVRGPRPSEVLADAPATPEPTPPQPGPVEATDPPAPGPASDDAERADRLLDQIAGTTSLDDMKELLDFWADEVKSFAPAIRDRLRESAAKRKRELRDAPAPKPDDLPF